MQQYADGRMQTRSRTGVVTQGLRVDRKETKINNSKETGSSIAILSKFLDSWQAGLIQERRLCSVEVKVTLGFSKWNIRTVYVI